MDRLLDSEALKLLEQPRRYLGWTEEQWALAAGQIPGKYNPVKQDAYTLRMDWLNSMQTLDSSKRDESFASQLFYNIARENHARGFDLMHDRAKDCG
jgi:hypothetical protein